MFVRVLILSLLSTACAGGDACPSAEALTRLSTHLDDLALSVAGLTGHGAADEVAVSLVVPGFAPAPAVLDPLSPVCAAAETHDERCADGVCWQVTCTGDGSGHRTLAWWDAGPLSQDGVDVQDASSQTTWDTAGALSWTTRSEVSLGDVDLSVAGTLSLDADGTLAVDEALPGLGGDRGASLVATLTADGATSAVLFADDDQLASLDGGELVADARCE